VIATVAATAGKRGVVLCVARGWRHFVRQGGPAAQQPQCDGRHKRQQKKAVHAGQGRREGGRTQQIRSPKRDGHEREPCAERSLTKKIAHV